MKLRILTCITTMAFLVVGAVAIPPAAQAQTYTVLYTFKGGTDGAEPYAGLIRDPAGNLYGTTISGGDLSCTPNNGFGCGVVFKISFP